MLPFEGGRVARAPIRDHAGVRTGEHSDDPRRSLPRLDLVRVRSCQFNPYASSVPRRAKSLGKRRVLAEAKAGDNPLVRAVCGIGRDAVPTGRTRRTDREDGWRSGCRPATTSQSRGVSGWGVGRPPDRGARGSRSVSHPPGKGRTRASRSRRGKPAREPFGVTQSATAATEMKTLHTISAVPQVHTPAAAASLEPRATPQPALASKAAAPPAPSPEGKIAKELHHGCAG